jgi:hypothetical protein
LYSLIPEEHYTHTHTTGLDESQRLQMNRCTAHHSRKKISSQILFNIHHTERMRTRRNFFLSGSFLDRSEVKVTIGCHEPHVLYTPSTTCVYTLVSIPSKSLKYRQLESENSINFPHFARDSLSHDEGTLWLLYINSGSVT